MKLFKTIFVLSILLIGHSCASEHLIIQHDKKQLIQKYSRTYFILHKKYEWLNHDIYNTVSENLDLYKLPLNEKLYLLKTLIALIDKESTGKHYATGKLCNVYLFKNGKTVLEQHRARGLMQVMVYNTTLKSTEVLKLYNIETNIYWGVKTFMKGYYQSKGDIEVSLKNYNSGINSDHFNWRYINSIIDDVSEM